MAGCRRQVQDHYGGFLQQAIFLSDITYLNTLNIISTCPDKETEAQEVNKFAQDHEARKAQDTRLQYCPQGSNLVLSSLVDRLHIKSLLYNISPHYELSNLL